jgi:hypothetical protein
VELNNNTYLQLIIGGSLPRDVANYNNPLWRNVTNSPILYLKLRVCVVLFSGFFYTYTLNTTDFNLITNPILSLTSNTTHKRFQKSVACHPQLLFVCETETFTEASLRTNPDILSSVRKGNHFGFGESHSLFRNRLQTEQCS